VNTGSPRCVKHPSCSGAFSLVLVVEPRGSSGEGSVDIHLLASNASCARNRRERWCRRTGERRESSSTGSPSEGQHFGSSGSKGYEATTVPQIARKAGVSHDLLPLFSLQGGGRAES